jgi:hypothetical protein
VRLSITEVLEHEWVTKRCGEIRELRKLSSQDDIEHFQAYTQLKLGKFSSSSNGATQNDSTTQHK